MRTQQEFVREVSLSPLCLMKRDVTEGYLKVCQSMSKEI